MPKLTGKLIPLFLLDTLTKFRGYGTQNTVPTATISPPAYPVVTSTSELLNGTPVTPRGTYIGLGKSGVSTENLGKDEIWRSKN